MRERERERERESERELPNALQLLKAQGAHCVAEAIQSLLSRGIVLTI